MAALVVLEETGPLEMGITLANAVLARPDLAPAGRLRVLGKAAALLRERGNLDEALGAAEGAVALARELGVAPRWLVSDVATFSKIEHQRDERVAAAAVQNRNTLGGQAAQAPTGKGRGRKGKGGDGGKAATRN